jgi:hypothetical protein
MNLKLAQFAVVFLPAVGLLTAMSVWTPAVGTMRHPTSDDSTQPKLSVVEASRDDADPLPNRYAFPALKAGAPLLAETVPAEYLPAFNPMAEIQHDLDCAVVDSLMARLQMSKVRVESLTANYGPLPDDLTAAAMLLARNLTGDLAPTEPPRVTGWLQQTWHRVDRDAGPITIGRIGIVTCCWQVAGIAEPVPAGWEFRETPAGLSWDRWVWLRPSGASATEMVRGWLEAGEWNADPEHGFDITTYHELAW